MGIASTCVRRIQLFLHSSCSPHWAWWVKVSCVHTDTGSRGHRDMGLSGGRFQRRHTTGWDRRHGTADRRSHQADSYPADFKSRSRATLSFYHRQGVLKFGFHRKRALKQDISYIYLIRVDAHTYVTQIIVQWRHFKTLPVPNLQTQSRVLGLRNGKLSFSANVADEKLSDI